MTFTADKIRNILLAGHGGSGKTALAEAMLFKSGATERMGSTNEGSTVSDFDPEEIRRKISINTSLAATVWQDTRINIIDAPGQFDFIGGMYEGIRAAESVVITVNGKDGVCPGTIKAYNLAAGQNKARMLAVTCMEVENSDFYKVHTQLKTVFGPSVCPIVVPYDKNGPVEAYINLLTMKAYKYDSKGVPTEVPMPASENRIAGLRASMAEAVAETNEEFMEKFFSGEDFTHDELVKGIHDGVASGAITPLVCCANDTLSGVDMLLDAVVSMLPSPNERKLESLDGVTLDYDENKPLKAFVFKTVADPFVGKISMLKIVQGKLTAGVSAVNATTGETVRIGKLLKLKFPWLPIGKLVMIPDMVVVILAAVVFGTVNAALYGLIQMYLLSKVMDMILYGWDTSRVAYIITDRWEETVRGLLDMNRGVTLLQGKGAYTGAEKQVLLVAFRQREIVPIKRMLREIDPKAFFIVCDAHEILGEGFGDYQKEEI